MTRKKLPIGIQTFAKIREDDCYYVDKTPFALRLVEEGSFYFLSRPRRFGKSLFLDTLAELFQCNEALFRGLYCHDKWDWAVKYPVIRFSFAEGVLQSREQLTARIQDLLEDNEQRLGLQRAGDSIPARFTRMIQKAEKQLSRRVVILVDEYDKPILDNLTNLEVAKEMRDGLRDLYSVIKGQDAHVKFTFLTGVSKFSKVNIFSGLNNLTDLTISSAFSAICGYTDEDVDSVFAPELPGLNREEIRHWYNGYNWTGEAVYNPFDLLLLFREHKFRPYWFETGTPTFLLDTLTGRRFFLPDLERIQADEALLSTFDVGAISTEALLFQTGYLTIAAEIMTGAILRYRLRFPNLEVRYSLMNALLQRCTPNPGDAVKGTSRLLDLLAVNDFSGIHDLINAMFAGIPSDWHRKNNIADYEGYYASVFYAYFAAIGLDVTPEDSSHAGRLDMALKFNEQIYLFEFKVVEIEPEGKALQQIQDRGYADKYQSLKQPLHLIGVEFSREQRKVLAFEVTTLNG